MKPSNIFRQRDEARKGTEFEIALRQIASREHFTAEYSAQAGPNTYVSYRFATDGPLARVGSDTQSGRVFEIIWMNGEHYTP